MVTEAPEPCAPVPETSETSTPVPEAPEASAPVPKTSETSAPVPEASKPKPCTTPKRSTPVGSDGCHWEAWGEWAPCKATCGGGLSSRSRKLVVVTTLSSGTVTECSNDAQTKPCGVADCPIDCVWEKWQTWSECSATCGPGSRSKRRTNIPAQFGGSACVDAFEKSIDCFLAECFSTWGEWSDWNGCSRTCGSGQEKRYRELFTAGSAGKYDEMRQCALNECPVDCSLGDWNEWEACSASCGSGEIRRVRPVEKQMAHGGMPCEYRTETAPCQQKCPANCEWGNWEDWSLCSASCGTGTQSHIRRISKRKDEHGLDCSGQETEDRICSLASCSSDCYISDWSMWSPCSSSCGTGSKQRSRIVHQPRDGGRPCPLGSNTYESIRCSIREDCPQDCAWADWAEWSTCSATCGDGRSSRGREVMIPAVGDGKNCSESSMQGRDCNEASCPISCEWGLWSDWFACTSSCGEGNKSRTRAVLQVPSNGGAACAGGNEEQQSCKTIDCPVDCMWGDWLIWGSCSSSCGTGTISRTRGRRPAAFGGAECTSAARETKDCESLPECPKDCVWNVWSDWQPCSVTCGSGYERKRRLRKSYETLGGRICKGAEEDERTCTSIPCPQDCQVGDWGPWSSCTSSCGIGARSRYRNIVQQANHGGHECDQKQENYSTYDVTGCFLGHCATDCLWDLWQPWSPCTKTCAGGYTSRLRKELVPAANGGHLCEDSAQEETVCNVHPCPVDCIWKEWAAWTSCSGSCGGGERFRQRSVSLASKLGGLQCDGNEKEKELCNTQNCPIDCQWSTWTLWTPCSETCDGGETARSRHHVTEEQNGGVPCTGPPAESKKCSTQGCPADCEWGPWSQWTPCSTTCGGGSITRVRDVSVNRRNGGAECLGPFKEEADCNNNLCPSDCIWEEWSPWPPCPVTCGGANIVSTRGKVKAEVANGAPCFGSSTREDRCNTQDCPHDCLLLDWSDWGLCTVSCGTGFAVRSRVKQAERFGGKPCSAPLTEVKECKNEENVPLCPYMASTTSPPQNVRYYVPEPGNDARLPCPKQQSSGSELKGPSSQQIPKPCTKDDLKATPDSYGSDMSRKVSDAIEPSIKVKTQLGKKVSELACQLYMYVQEGDGFVASAEAGKAVKKALCSLTHIQEQNLKVEMNLQSFTQPLWQKKQRGNVLAAFAIEVFENDNIGDANALGQWMVKHLKPDTVTAAIQNQLKAEAGLNRFSVEATSLSVKISQEAP